MNRERVDKQPRSLLKPTAVALAVGLCVSSAAQSATINVGAGCSIIDAINAANNNTMVNSCVSGDAIGTDVIEIPANAIYTYSVATLISSNGSGGYEPNSALPLVTSDLQINGNGATISRDAAATEDFRLLYLAANGTLTLNSITLSNGVADGQRLQTRSGGAIYSRGGAVNLNNVTLLANSSNLRGGGVHSRGNLTIVDSTISNNVCPGNGGGVSVGNQGSLSLQDSTVSDNIGGTGGGISGYSATGNTIYNSSIRGNTSNFTGGGISIAGFVDVSESAITFNSSGSSRGAGIEVFDLFGAPGSLVITDSTINNNTGGPGVSTTNDVVATVIDSTINSNTGGGLDLQAATELSGLTIRDNGSGGAGVKANGPELIFDNNTVTNNESTGATLVSATITNSTFTQNGSGGLQASSGEASQITVSSNTGASGLSAANMVMDNITVNNNSSSIKGAGISGNNIEIKDSTVTSNSSSDLGGGIYLRGQSQLENVYIAYNTGTSGGGIYARQSTISITNSQIVSNEGTSFVGGGAAFRQSTTSISNSRISSNRLAVNGSRGGGVHAAFGGSLNISNSLIAGSSANGSGAGLYVSNVDTNITNTTFFSNRALNSGGAITARSGPTTSTTIRGSTIHNNTASLAGGLENGGAVSIQNSIITSSVGGDCDFPIENSTNNWFEDASCDGNAQGSPMLGPAVATGGFSVAFSLLPGSGAIDAGGECGLETDIVGTARSICKCDIGSFEVPEATPDNSSCKGSFFVIPLPNDKSVIFEL